MDGDRLRSIVEAALLAAGEPLNVERLLALFRAEDGENPSRAEVRAALERLQEEYRDRGVELVEVADGFRFQTRAAYARWINRLWEERPPRYSRALLETLAIIAYRQPITRGEIEEIRGVSVSSSIIKTLLEREWIRVVSHREVPGRPALYGTTRAFLDYFNLRSLADLPSLAELKEIEGTGPDLFAAAGDTTPVAGVHAPGSRRLRSLPRPRRFPVRRR